MACSRLGVIELVGYREWTETLGHDREWRIQHTQARLYASLQDAAKDLGAYIVPLRMDYMVFLAENVEGLEELTRVLEEESPTPYRIVVAKARSPREAERASTLELGRTRLGELRSLELCRGEEFSTIAHIDINDITRTMGRDGVTVYTSYVHVVSLYNRLQERLLGEEAIVSYLGGDNIIAILPPGGEKIVESIVDSSLKAGVGVSRTPREALALATLALDTIRREGRKQGRVMVIRDRGLIEPVRGA